MRRDETYYGGRAAQLCCWRYPPRHSGPHSLPAPQQTPRTRKWTEKLWNLFTTVLLLIYPMCILTRYSGRIPHQTRYSLMFSNWRNVNERRIHIWLTYSDSYLIRLLISRPTCEPYNSNINSPAQSGADPADLLCFESIWLNCNTILNRIRRTIK